MSLPGEWRERIEEYVRPLYTELDGIDTFDRVEELERRLEVLARDGGHDEPLLELLALFHGVVPRLGSLAPGGRWQLFLTTLGASPDLVRRLRRGLERFAESPAGPEEELLHDAALLEHTGVRAALQRLLDAGRRRLRLERALAQLDAGPGPDRFRTTRGREIAAARQRATGDWIARLRARLEAESDSSRSARRPGG